MRQQAKAAGGRWNQERKLWFGYHITARGNEKKRPEDWKWSSYRATAGLGPPAACVTIDWVLGQFSRKRSKAETEYRQFIEWGIGKETIWREVKGQSMLG